MEVVGDAVTLAANLRFFDWLVALFVAAVVVVDVA
jgi:hypothetical protein